MGLFTGSGKSKQTQEIGEKVGERAFKSVNPDQIAQNTNLKASTIASSQHVPKQVKPQPVATVQHPVNPIQQTKAVPSTKGSETKDKVLQKPAPITVIAIEDEDTVLKEKVKKVESLPVVKEKVKKAESDTDESSSEDSESETSDGEEEEGEVNRDAMIETQKENTGSSESAVSNPKKRKTSSTEDDNDSSTKKKKSSSEMREIPVEECDIEEIKGKCGEDPFVLHKYIEKIPNLVWWMTSEITSLLMVKNVVARSKSIVTIKIKLPKGGPRIFMSTENIIKTILEKSPGPLASAIKNAMEKAIGKTVEPVKNDELNEPSSHLIQMDTEHLNHHEDIGIPSYTQYMLKVKDRAMFEYVEAVFNHLEKKKKS